MIRLAIVGPIVRGEGICLPTRGNILSKLSIKNGIPL